MLQSEVFILHVFFLDDRPSSLCRGQSNKDTRMTVFSILYLPSILEDQCEVRTHSFIYSPVITIHFQKKKLN